MNLNEMKTAFYCIAFLGLILASCGTPVKVTSDYDRANDFSGYKTFTVYDIKTKGQVSSLNADRIVNAIKAELTKKGFIEISSNPDLQINALTFLKDKQAVTANTNYYGYGGDYRSYGYWGAGIGGSTSYDTYNYKDGSLIIDIIDTKTKKMVWTGTGNAEIDKAPKDPDEFIAGAVKKILSAFPPGK